MADEKAAAEEEASEAARRRGDQPTLAQAAALAAEAEDLPVDAELKTRLDEIVHAGEDWEARCAAVLNPKQVRALSILEQCGGGFLHHCLESIHCSVLMITELQRWQCLLLYSSAVARQAYVHSRQLILFDTRYLGFDQTAQVGILPTHDVEHTFTVNEVPGCDASQCV